MEYLSDEAIRALRLAIEAHAGQTDKAGMAYIHHPVTVAMILAKNGYSDRHIAAALLHDVVEDTNYTLTDLLNMGFSKEVVEALSFLTHDEGTPYLSYVKKVISNPIAKVVKMADLTHNLDESRIVSPSNAHRKRWAKYREALNLLTND